MDYIPNRLAIIALIVLTTSCSWFTSYLFAQRITASLSLEKREPRPLWFEYCRADDGLVTLSYMSKNSSREIGLIKYNAQFKRQWVKNLFDNSSQTNIEFLGVVGERILIFVSERQSREKQTSIYYYEYTLGGQAIEKRKLLYHSEMRKADKNVLSFVYSTNKKKLLAFENYREKDKNERTRFFVFDTESTAPVIQEITLPFPDRRLDIKQVAIGNLGNVFMLTRLDPEKARNDESSTFLLFKFYAAESRLVRIELPFKKMIITDLALKTDRNENIFLGGFYSNRNSTDIIGTVLTQIDAVKDSALFMRQSPFDKNLLLQFLSNKQIERGRELSDFYLDKMVLRTDGGVMLMAEQFYVSNQMYRDIYGFWYSREVYHYNDILILSIAPDGEIEWTTVVGKSQVSESMRELSYLSAVGPEQLLLFYKTRMKGFGQNVYFTEVSYAGQASPPKPFFEDYRASDVFFRQFCEQIDNEMIILVYLSGRPKRFTIAKVAI